MQNRDLVAQKVLAALVDDRLGERFPQARCALNYSTPLELLVATVLSAQCTDKRVNQTTIKLFSIFTEAQDYAEANREVLEDIIRPLGFFRTKAASLQGIGRELVARFSGEVPGTLDELVSLPGVGRKTANVVLGEAFGVPGITVDTHVGRVSRRLGWTTATNPVQVEHDIAELFPAERWTQLGHRLIFLGRSICHSRRPACGACVLADVCPSSGEGIQDPNAAQLLVKEQE